MAKDISKIDREILKKTKVTKVDASGSFTTIHFTYTGKQKGVLRLKNKKLTGSIMVCTNPTNNCQVNSFLSFYYILNAFRYNISYKKNTIQWWNNRAYAWASLKALAYYCKNHNRKRQYIIDINQVYVPTLKKVNKLLFTKRDPKREVNYTSTNGSPMMYTMLVIDEEKRDAILDIK